MSEIQSAPHKLFAATLSRLTAELELREVPGKAGGAYMALISQAPFHQGQCGEVRVFKGKGDVRVVCCSLGAPAIGLDSHMIFALTEAASPVPHFTLDSVQAGDHLAFHLDLVPKTDLAVNLPYIEWAFAPLNSVHEQSYSIEGLSRAHVTPTQHAVMSPWMLVHRAVPSAFAQIGPLVDQYLDHWLAVHGGGVPEAVTASLADADLAARDTANRALIFDPRVDPVWGQIAGLIGKEAGAAMRDLLKGGTIHE